MQVSLCGSPGVVNLHCFLGLYVLFVQVVDGILSLDLKEQALCFLHGCD